MINNVDFIIVCIIVTSYIYPLDSQESAKDALHRESNYSNLFLEMLRYCYLVKILGLFKNLI